MAKIKSSFFDIFNLRALKRYELYGITFALTYLITISFTVFVVLNYYEDLMVQNNILDYWTFLNNTSVTFSFGYCTGLDAWTYLFAKIVETLIPTTLTFSGAILILQTKVAKDTSLDAMLFISLVCLTIAGIGFMIARLPSVLFFYMWLLFFLFCIVFMFSAKLFNIQNEEDNLHKNEESDGIMTGRME